MRLLTLALTGCVWIGGEQHAESLRAVSPLEPSEAVIGPELWEICESPEFEVQIAIHLAEHFIGETFDVIVLGGGAEFTTQVEAVEGPDGDALLQLTQVLEATPTRAEFDLTVRYSWGDRPPVELTRTVRLANANEAWLDLDNDGYGGEPTVTCEDPATTVGLASVGGDCNDANDAIHPGADEIPCNGLDDDCDGQLHFDETDHDNDGFVQCVGSPLPGGDCAPHDPAINPIAPDICDGIDANCDPSTPDETDADGDGWVVCVMPGPSANPAIEGGGDCDDADGLRFPGAPELCNGRDDDCDGDLSDDELDLDADGFMGCATGWPGSPQPGDCEPLVAEVFPGNHAERCDGYDTNCDGFMLESEQDLDADGWLACTIPPNVPRAPGILGGDDCDDEAVGTYPGAIEICSGVLENCDHPLPLNEQDLDGDGYMACDPAPHVTVPGNDCDDDDASVYPGATERCDGKRNDCSALPADQAVDGWFAGGVTHSVWADAVAAAVAGSTPDDPNTLLVCEDIDATTQIATESGVVVDLRGHQWTGRTLVSGGAALTVRNGSYLVGPATISSRAGEGFAITGSALTLDHVDLSCTPGNTLNTRAHGVDVVDGTLTVTDSSISGCHATTGGAIHAKSSEVQISGSVFTSNKAQQRGGALYLDQSPLTASNNDWNSNADTATRPALGGAIFAVNSDLDINDDFVGNQANNGGALAFMRKLPEDNTYSDFPSLNLNASTFIENIGLTGSAVHCDSDSGVSDSGSLPANQHMIVFAQEAEFVDNVALTEDEGGAFHALVGCDVTFNDVVMTGNVNGAFRFGRNANRLECAPCDFTPHPDENTYDVRARPNPGSPTSPLGFMYLYRTNLSFECASGSSCPL